MLLVEQSCGDIVASCQTLTFVVVADNCTGVLEQGSIWCCRQLQARSRLAGCNVFERFVIVMVNEIRWIIQLTNQMCCHTELLHSERLQSTPARFVRLFSKMLTFESTARAWCSRFVIYFCVQLYESSSSCSLCAILLWKWE